MCVFSVALSLSTAVIGYNTYMNAVLDRYREFAAAALMLADAYVDADDMVNCLKTNQKSDTYNYVSQPGFNAIKERTGITFLYLFKPDGNEMIYYINAFTQAEVNALQEREFIVSLNNRDPLPAEIYERINSLSNNDIWYIPTVSEYGYMMGAYRAVRSSSGDIIGVLAAEINMDTIISTVERYVITVIIGAAVIMFIFTSLTIIYLRRKITAPIQNLSFNTENFVNHSPDEELKPIISSIKTKDEIETLSHSIEKMTSDMITYIDNLTAVTAERERIGAELTVATQIQASMLPRVFPKLNELEIFASMQPAKEVGGDFYDFFFVDKNTLAIVMADVSGKGVPAALFMVIAKTLIKTNAQRGLSPKEVFMISNDMLCENNDAEMFVTAFMGYLNIKSGKFTFVNAGHNPPVLKHNGKFNWLETKVGFVLAGMEGMVFTEGEITFEPGDEIFLYTDGVTEAHDIDDNLFSDPRLLEEANKCEYNTLEEFTTHIKSEIDTFAGEAPQADDITMLMLKYKGE